MFTKGNGQITANKADTHADKDDADIIHDFHCWQIEYGDGIIELLYNWSQNNFEMLDNSDFAK